MAAASEDADDADNRSQAANDDPASHLTQEEKEYLQKRHGTLDLDPMPSADPLDPYNWPGWKKITNLLLVSSQTFVAGVIAAGITVSYDTLSKEYEIPIQNASYLTSLQIAFLGFGPLIWSPVSKRYGRRPVFLVSLFVSCISSVGSALSTTYTEQIICRAIQAFFLSPAYALGSMVVTECFFASEAGRYMGIWTEFTTLGPPAGPLIMGFVAQRLPHEWIFWIFAMINAVQFLLQLFLGPETRYVRPHRSDETPTAKTATLKSQYLSLRRLDATPFNLREFYRPFARGFSQSRIAVPALSYGVLFSLCSVFLTVLVPQLFIPKFGLSPQGIGLQYLGLVVGTILGEQAAGPLSDRWMSFRRARNARGAPPAPEFRLWVSYVGFAAAVAGLVVFCVQTAAAPQGSYNVTPVVGAGVAAVGNQIVTTVVMTYAVEGQPNSEAATIGAFVNVSRQTFGFVGPFWFTPMIDTLGLVRSAAVLCAIVVGVCMLPIAFVQWRGTVIWDAQQKADGEDDRVGLTGDAG